MTSSVGVGARVGVTSTTIVRVGAKASVAQIIATVSARSAIAGTQP